MPGSQDVSSGIGILIEGAGDVVEALYEPALQRVMKRLAESSVAVSLTFTDVLTKKHRANAQRERKRQRIRKKIMRLEATYIIKDGDASSPADRARYKSAKPHVIIIATPEAVHVDVAKHWLKNGRRFSYLFIEKPLTDNLDKARELLGHLPAGSKVMAFDHYRAKFLPTDSQMESMLAHLGGRLTRYKFFFLEDHSRWDRDKVYLRGKNLQAHTPIEMEERVETVNGGLILDMMPHVLALIPHFGDLGSVGVSAVRAARYRGVNGDEDAWAKIAKETFAQIAFTFFGHRPVRPADTVHGMAYIGKGIRGAKAQIDGSFMPSPVKVLELEGVRGQRVWINFSPETKLSSHKGISEGCQAYCVRSDGRTENVLLIGGSPYEVLFQQIVEVVDRQIAKRGHRREDDPFGALPATIAEAKRTLEIIEDMRWPINQKYQCYVDEKKRPADWLPGYLIGKSSPTLEEVISRIGDPIYGSKRSLDWRQ